MSQCLINLEHKLVLNSMILWRPTCNGKFVPVGERVSAQVDKTMNLSGAIREGLLDRAGARRCAFPWLATCNMPCFVSR